MSSSQQPASVPVTPSPAAPLADNGYGWWYVDGVSRDGDLGITLIAMLGSVFSPYYAKARRKEPTTPLHFPAFNAVVYGPGSSKRWALTEYPAGSAQCREDSLVIGANRLLWTPGRLEVQLRETAVPWGGAIRGKIVVTWDNPPSTPVPLDPKDRHQWIPVAPAAQIRVELEEPNFNFEGHGYHDANTGTEPLEACFDSWSWSRITSGDQTGVAYDVRLKGGHRQERGWVFDADGSHSSWKPSSHTDLGQTGWRIDRPTRGESSVQLLRTLEDTPFYNRSLVSGDLLGRTATGIHEFLSLERFSTRWVQHLLRWKTRRQS